MTGFLSQVWACGRRVLLVTAMAALPCVVSATTTTLTEFTVPTASSGPTSITAGPDGNLWFTEISGIKIGQISPAGTIREFSLPTSNSPPYGIIAGPDGNLWFTEAEQTFNPVSKVGRITPAGVITEFTIAGFLNTPN